MNPIKCTINSEEIIGENSKLDHLNDIAWLEGYLCKILKLYAETYKPQSSAVRF